MDRRRRMDRLDERALRFEYCCGAECSEECRRAAMWEAFARMTPLYGVRVG